MPRPPDMACAHTRKAPNPSHTTRTRCCPPAPQPALSQARGEEDVEDESAYLEHDMECVRTLTGHTDKLYGCALSYSGKVGLTCSADKTLRVWDVWAATCSMTLRGHTDVVLCCAISASTKLALSGGRDRCVKVIAAGRSRRSQPQRWLLRWC